MPGLDQHWATFIAEESRNRRRGGYPPHQTDTRQRTPGLGHHYHSSIHPLLSALPSIRLFYYFPHLYHRRHPSIHPQHLRPLQTHTTCAPTPSQWILPPNSLALAYPFPQSPLNPYMGTNPISHMLFFGLALRWPLEGNVLWIEFLEQQTPMICYPHEVPII